MKHNLKNKKCIPCEGGAQALSNEEAKNYLVELDHSWSIDNKKIRRDLKFKDFKEAIKFVNKVAKLAEKEGHHPDLHIFYNKVRIELWTHAVSGLTENDFILAAKIDLI